MKCSNCGRENPPDAKFCNQCGESLPGLGVRDPRRVLLERLLPESLREKIEVSGPIEGERRQVTVLFADLSGFTTLSQKLDPEEVVELTNHCWEALIPVVYRFEGYVDKFIGDALLVLFGAPIAHEDDPERAIRCALAMRDALREMGRSSVADAQVPLDLHIGINTGLVVAGAMGAEREWQYSVLGDTVNLASRLVDAAAPGQILISQATKRLVESAFELQSLDPLAVKGIAGSVAVSAVVRALEHPIEVPPASPLVGRDQEMEALVEALHQLTQGRGRMISVVGEAGIGKSRLVAEFGQKAREQGVRWWIGRCFAHRQSLGYGPWMDLLRDALGLRGGEDLSAQPPRLAEAVRDLLSAKSEEVLPFLASLLNWPMVPTWEDRVRYLDAKSLRERVFLAVKELLAGVAHESPLVLVLEDLHWSDPTSLDLLKAVWGLCAEAPFQLLAIYRPPANGDPTASLASEAAAALGDRYSEMLLSPLSENQAALIARHLLGIPALPPPLERLITEKGEGNPFYVEEVVRALIDQGLLRRRDGIWESTPELENVAVPPTVQGVIMARIDTLAAERRNLLQQAAVIGRRFDSALLERISGLPAVALGESLAVLKGLEFIRELADGGMRRFAFKHALTQEVAYETLLKRRRRIIHRQVGEAVEELHREALEEQVELLAYHFERAEAWEKAWSYNLWAGKKARRRYANQEAISFLEIALKIAVQLPRIEIVDRVDVHILLADVLSGINRYDEALSQLEGGLSLVSVLPPSEAMGVTLARLHHKVGLALRGKGEYGSALKATEQAIQALPEGQVQERGALKIALASILTRQGEYEAAQRWCEEGLRDVEASGDQAELAHAYSLLGTIRRDLGDTAASLAHRQKSLGLSQAVDDLALQVEAHNNLAVAYYDLGHLDQAIAHYQNSRELSERIGNLNTMARAEINLGEVYLLRGDLTAAEQGFRRALETWNRTGYRLGQAYGLANMGGVLTRQGKPKEALSQLQRSEEIFTELGGRGFLTSVHRRQAGAYLSMGSLDVAEGLALRSLDLARELSMTQEEGAALRVLGMIYREKGELTRAEERLQRSVALFREAGIQYEEARGLYELAKLWYTGRNFVPIVPALNHAIEIFRSLGAEADLKHAEALGATLQD